MSSPDSPLTKDQLQTLRRMLEGERSRILKALQDPPSRVPSDDERTEFEETAQRSDERERLLEIAERARALLGEVERAIGKLDDGTYGVSEKSGAPIRYERLVAVPWARADVDE